MMPWASALNIQTEGEPDQYIITAHILGSWAVYSKFKYAHLCAGVASTAKRGTESNAEHCIGQMEDTKLGASRGEATHKAERPKHTGWDKHTPDHRPTRGVGKMVVEISQGSSNAPRDP